MLLGYLCAMLITWLTPLNNSNEGDHGQGKDLTYWIWGLRYGSRELPVPMSVPRKEIAKNPGKVVASSGGPGNRPWPFPVLAWAGWIGKYFQAGIAPFLLTNAGRYGHGSRP